MAWTYFNQLSTKLGQRLTGIFAMADTGNSLLYEALKELKNNIAAGGMALISNPTNHNLAETDGTGQAVDSGIAKGDVVTATVAGTDGHLAVFDGASKKIKDGGVVPSVEGLMPIPEGTTEDHLAAFDANGGVKDGGATSQFAASNHNHDAAYAPLDLSGRLGFITFNGVDTLSGSPADANVAVTTGDTGYTPAAGDKLAFLFGDDPAVIGTHFAKVLVTDSGVKVTQKAGYDFSGKSFIAVVCKA